MVANTNRVSNSQQIFQTKEDRTESITLLKNATNIVENPFWEQLDLVESLSILNDEEKKIVDLSAFWFIEYDSKTYLVQSNKLKDQLIPKGSTIIRSNQSGQLLRISAVSGGSI